MGLVAQHASQSIIVRVREFIQELSRRCSLWAVRVPTLSDGKRAEMLLQGYDTAQRGQHRRTLLSSRRLNDILLRAQISTSARRMMYLSAGAIATFSILLAAMLSSALPLLMIAFAGALFSIVIMQRIQRRTLGFEKDYTALLLSLASSVKAGIDPGSALAQAEVLFTKSSEVAQELKRYNEVIHRGGSEHEALTAFGATIDHPDLALFKEAFALSRSEGGSLGETLYRLARVTRQRQSFRRKSKSAVAMQKLSAFGIIGCCSVVGIFQAVSNTKGFFETFQSPLGIKLFVIGMILIATGFIWMIRMTRVRI